MEQPERVLLLIFLLKLALDDEQLETFNQIVEFLYNLSDLRRFNDALLFTLDDIKYFGTHECDILFQTLHTEFFNQVVSKRTQLLYIGFLVNICWSCHSKVYERFDQYFDYLCKRLVPAIDWENLVNTQERS